jgi:hypothetical protein
LAGPESSDIRQYAIVQDVDYRVVNGRVEIASGDDVLWWGEIDGRLAWRAMALPGTDDGVVVFDWIDVPAGVERWHPYENLSRVRLDGSIVWTAPLPTGEKSYTQAAWDEGRLIGHGWASAVELDPETGHIRSQWFTK